MRYALNIPFGDKAQDLDYKTELLPYVLRSGGRIIVEATEFSDFHASRNASQAAFRNVAR